MNDLASGTSSWSTKLIHGGLRYLEFYEFRLVREALKEREVLWRNAPHIVHPLRFVLPHHSGQRPAWMIRLGLFLYDHLGGRERLPATTKLDLRTDPAGAPLKPSRFTTGFEYSDCFVDDARLVVLNALDAQRRGATIATRTRVIGARRDGDVWELTSEGADGTRTTTMARTLVNAAGPWVDTVLGGVIRANARAHVRLVQGSHIVVRRLFDHDRAYILQNTDGRIVFAIPYQRDFTLIGTTDRDYVGDPARVTATDDEIAYLCDAISRDFAKTITTADVVWSYSGVRPLYDDGASEAKAATRDYVFELDGGDSRAPVLSIFGGKITTYRRLAEAALDRLAAKTSPELARRLKTRRGWTTSEPLPGGDFMIGSDDIIAADLTKRLPACASDHIRRLVTLYGTRAADIVRYAPRPGDLGRHFGGTLTEAEVRFLMAEEWARTAEDIVWRRTKLGLVMTAGEITALDTWMSQRRQSMAAPTT
jgi:glycerol-3-phosphate dehydrogenase